MPLVPVRASHGRHRAVRLTVIAILACNIGAVAQSYSTIYAFKAPRNSGAMSGGLTPDAFGNLYGGTSVGGKYGNGQLFYFSPPAAPGGAWQQHVFHSFSPAEGPGPSSNLTLDAAGYIYGASFPPGAYGSIFRFIPPTKAGGAWTETILYTFPGGAAGANPSGDVVFDASGNMFGVTSAGGQYGLGTIFELSPPATPGGTWTETVLHSFQGKWDGANPVTLDHDLSGPLFGICGNGGSANAGTVFRLYPPTATVSNWSFRVLYTFSGGDDGAHPSGLTIYHGVKYGTTSAGGQYGKGTAFHIVYANNVFTTSTIYQFGAVSGDGSGPIANLVADSAFNLYGVTAAGGTANLGTVYKLTPPAVDGDLFTATQLYSFNGIIDGSTPQGRLVRDTAGNLYGTTLMGPGNTANSSTIFEVSP